jgi:hypothetical protein
MSENAFPELEAGRWVKAQVEAACDDRINGAFLDIIPENVNMPAVRYEVYTREDVRTSDQHIVWSRIVMRVFVTIQGERITPWMLTIAADIHACLHKNRGETTNARIVACTRLEPYGRTEQAGAEVFRHAGGLYEILVMGLPETP